MSLGTSCNDMPIAFNTATLSVAIFEDRILIVKTVVVVNHSYCFIRLATSQPPVKLFHPHLEAHSPVVYLDSHLHSVVSLNNFRDQSTRIPSPGPSNLQRPRVEILWESLTQTPLHGVVNDGRAG